MLKKYLLKNVNNFVNIYIFVRFIKRMITKIKHQKLFLTKNYKV